MIHPYDSLKYWNDHRELTAAALNGQSAHFKTAYGYLPKCIYGSRKNYRKHEALQD